MRLPLLAPLVVMLLAAPAGSQPPQHGRQDYEFARDAVTRGDFLPLDRILTIVGRSYPGQLVELELEMEDGQWVYEVEIVTTDGRLIEVDLNAATGEILDVDDADD